MSFQGGVFSFQLPPTPKIENRTTPPSEMAFSTFENLAVWQRGLEQAVRICGEVDAWKNFSLKDQRQRSAISVPPNIAEGHERDSPGDFIRFLRIAKGSNGEMRTQTYIAQRLGLLRDEIANEIVSESKEISAMLQGLVRSIEARRSKTEN